MLAECRLLKSDRPDEIAMLMIGSVIIKTNAPIRIHVRRINHLFDALFFILLIYESVYENKFTLTSLRLYLVS